VGEFVVPIELLLATTAKVLCSAVFVSGREPEEAFRNSATSALHANQLPQVLARHARWSLDRAGGRVDVRMDIDAAVARELVDAHSAAYPGFDADWAGEARRLEALRSVTRSAQFMPDQGCLIVPPDGDRDVAFTPVRLRRGPAPSRNWCGAERTLAPVQQALDDAFADTDACHAAMLVVHRGDIVAERYAPGLTADQPLESWSMGKSVMATLIGLLVGRDALSLDAPAPVPAWRASGDPRSEITLRHLLNMSSGLRCTGQDDPRSSWRHGLPEHFLPYAEAVSVAEFATSRPAEHPPETVGRYRNCDPLTLASIFHATVRTLGGDPLSWPQTELFDRLGMHGLTHEPDRWGRFIVSGFNYGTARDWSRLGLLYLRDGMWQGQRVLPDGWARFVRTPAPAWKQGNYGGQFWINSTGEFVLPPDTFYMAGGGGQYVFIVPSADLVIVRMGHSRGWAASKAKVDDALAAILAGLAQGDA
jgi:CubicO group peptidase (beta-lactamase class C family)